MIKNIIAVLLISLLPLTAFAVEQKETAYDRVMRTGTLRCGFIPWPPGFEIDPNTGVIKGPSKELFESIIRLTGWKVEFVQTAMGSVPLDLQNDKFDVMCADGPWTITNIRLVDYTTPATYSPVFIYVRANEARFQSYADFDSKDVTFVGIDGDISADLTAVRFPHAKMHTLGSLTDPAQMMMEVADNKADAVILDPVTGEGFIKNNPGKIKAFPGDTLAVYPVGMSVRWGEDQLKQVLNRATEMAINIGLADQKLDLYDPARKTIYSPARPFQEPGKK